MIPISAEALADVIGGDLVGDGHDGQITGVSIDSRTTMPGDLFVALHGEHVDGHDYIDKAAARGATAYLCAASAHPDLADRLQGLPGGVVVDDPLDALTGLGAWVRDTVNPIVVAVTGSNGKTTTKDLAAAAIGAGKATVANPGSFNNELGLPLTLCLLEPHTEVLVCEIGARGIGHIADAMPIVRPDVAIVTTVTGAHLGEFGSLDAVWEAKGELVEALDVDGTAILNADLAGVEQHVRRSAGRVLTFGMTDTADLHPDAWSIRADGRGEVTVLDEDGTPVTFVVPLPGIHNIANALAALLAARQVGVPLSVAANGLEAAAVSRWRMDVTTTASGMVIVNDAYNANPQSMTAALDTVASMTPPGADAAGRRVAVLGYMAELGDAQDALHAQVGAHVASRPIDILIVVDPRATGLADGARDAGFSGTIHQAPDAAAAADLVAGIATPADLVLIKASRSIGLEVVADRLTSDAGAGAA